MACLRAGARLPQLSSRNPFRLGVSRFCSAKAPDADIETILATPSWSVRSLLPDQASQPSSPSVTPKQLHHLLRLSALPQPASKEDEQSMLNTLESQIHFVKDIQRVDTTGVEPLRSIRDESAAAVQETTVGIEHLQAAMAKEQVIGRRKRIQRVPGDKNTRPDGSIWDGNALGAASRTKGKYFVVDTGK